MNTSILNQGSSNHPPSEGGGLATTADGTDNLTSQIAGMSKHQLYQIVSQMKDLIQQNQQQARQILIANPQLTKTLFQAQIMLGMVRAPDSLPPAVLTPTQASTEPMQPPQPSPSPTPVLQVPPAPSPPPSISSFQPLSSPHPVPQQVPPQQPSPQMASPFLQQSQAANASPQATQPSFQYQQSVQTPPHSSQATTLQPTMQQHAPSQPPLPIHPPPLPQQPRPLAPPSQAQQQSPQGTGFTSPPAPQAYHAQPPYMQQVGASPQNNTSASFQQMHLPPLPNQPPPQQMYQVPREMGANTNIGSGGMLAVGGGVESGRGLNVGMPYSSAPPMTWNQSLPSTGPAGVPQVTPAGHMVPGQYPFVGGVGFTPSMAPGLVSNPSQPYNQLLIPSQPPQQPQPQPQMPIELEQQKALLQQVMNLTPEQINSLPPEQRQQVLQLQQAFRSQTG